ncbi:PASTA domain-containing protein [Streptomyces sp. NPDC004096]|uniref:PASTA domain-containing protein n=1 Tax=unclassified Streptomyces TaxID=2593676 RepID=UPI0033A27AFA
MNAINRFANSAEAPDFDAPQILRRTRRRRTIGVAAVAAALIAAGGGTALATSVAGGSSSTPVATSTATNSDATTMLFDNHGVTIPIDFAGWSLDVAKTYMEKTQTKLGTVTKKAVKGCKPGSVIGVSPHAPKIVEEGDTVNFTVCAG